MSTFRRVLVFLGTLKNRGALERKLRRRQILPTNTARPEFLGLVGRLGWFVIHGFGASSGLGVRHIHRLGCEGG